MARVLEREYGGMNEVLYNLAAVSGDAQWAYLAHRFDHEAILRSVSRRARRAQGPARQHDDPEDHRRRAAI